MDQKKVVIAAGSIVGALSVALMFLETHQIWEFVLLVLSGISPEH